MSTYHIWVYDEIDQWLYRPLFNNTVDRVVGDTMDTYDVRGHAPVSRFTDSIDVLLPRMLLGAHVIEPEEAWDIMRVAQDKWKGR